MADKEYTTNAFKPRSRVSLKKAPILPPPVNNSFSVSYDTTRRVVSPIALPHKLRAHVGRAALFLLVAILPLMTLSCGKPDDDPDDPYEDYDPFEWRWHLQPTNDEPTATPSCSLHE